MNKMRAIGGIVAAGCCLLAVSGRAGEKAKAKGKSAQPPPEEMAKMMAAFEKLAAPGAPHKALTERVGQWEYTNKMWMAPDAPPTEVKGTSVIRSIFDGRFIIEDISGEMMGKAFKGMAISGYDNFRKQHIGTWCDSMGTSIMLITGTMDKAGKTLTMTGRSDDLMTGEKDKLYKFVTKIASKDKHTMEIWEVPKQGKPIKMMEMTSTRKK